MIKLKDKERQAEEDERMMRKALEEAREACVAGEVPVGAVIAVNGRVVAKAHNLTEALCDVTAHAEMQAITSASMALGGKYLPDCTLYVTVEPCAMCAGALGWSQIGRIVYGASDVKRGFKSYYMANCGPACSPLHPKTIVEGGLLEEECRALMREFFKSKR